MARRSLKGWRLGDRRGYGTVVHMGNPYKPLRSWVLVLVMVAICLGSAGVGYASYVLGGGPQATEQQQTQDVLKLLQDIAQPTGGNLYQVLENTPGVESVAVGPEPETIQFSYIQRCIVVRVESDGSAGNAMVRRGACE